MKHRVSLTHEARRQLLESALWWSEHRDPEQALEWLGGFEAAINGFADNADRCREASESGHFPYPLYQLLYGLRKKPTHRAVFRLQGDVVEVLAIRHFAQDTLSPGDYA